MVVIRQEAEADLEQIFEYVAQDSVPRAHRLVDRLLERCQILARLPYAGRARPEFGPGLRSLVERPYLIFYRVLPGDQAEVVAFFHGARDLPAVIAERLARGEH